MIRNNSPVRFRNRCLSLVAAVTLVAGSFAATPSASAAQSVSGTLTAAAATHKGEAPPHLVELGATTLSKICLKNANASCAAGDVLVDISLIISDILNVILIWKGINKGGKKEEESKGTQGGGSEGDGKCASATGGRLFFGSCNSIDAEWIVQPHGNGGDYFESYYSLKCCNNAKYIMVLNPNNGGYLFVHALSPGAWADWAFYNASSSSRHEKPVSRLSAEARKDKYKLAA